MLRSIGSQDWKRDQIEIPKRPIQSSVHGEAEDFKIPLAALSSMVAEIAPIFLLRWLDRVSVEGLSPGWSRSLRVRPSSKAVRRSFQEARARASVFSGLSSKNARESGSCFAIAHLSISVCIFEKAAHIEAVSQARQANELLQHFNFADEENLYLIGQAAPLLFVALAAVQKEEWFRRIDHGGLLYTQRGIRVPGFG